MYDIIQGVEYVKKSTDEGMSQWILIKAENGITYQVKFNKTSRSSNTNEFIGNFIGSSIGVPVPNGIFLMIPDNILEECQNNLAIHIDRDTVKENIFFGTQWLYGKVEFRDVEFLLEEIPKTNNYEEYPSIFPYDQYLRNQDRHVENHLIVQDNDKQRFYYSIDSDRIFAGFPIVDLLTEKNEFKCFENQKYKELYDSISEEFFAIILRYSAMIESLTDNQLNQLDEYIESYYDIQLSIRDDLREFLNFRKNDLSKKCIDNQECYTTLEQHTLMI